MFMMPTAFAASWDIATFLDNAAQTLRNWGGLLFMLLGVVLIIVGVWQAVKGLAAHGKTQTNWFIVLACLIVGGALAATTGTDAWTFVSEIASGGKATITDLGTGGGFILPFLP